MKIIKFFTPSKALLHPRPNYISSCEFLIKTSLLLALITSVLAIHHFYNAATMAGAINLSIAFVSLVNVFFFRAIGDLDFSAHMTLMFSLTLLCSHFLTANKEYYPFHLVWVACFPVFATNLLPKTYSKLWTVLAFVSFASCLIIRHYDLSSALYDVSGDRLLKSAVFSLFMSLVLVYNLVKNSRQKEELFHDESERFDEEKSHLHNAISYNIANSAQALRLITEEVRVNQSDKQMLDFSDKVLKNLSGIEEVVKNIQLFADEKKISSKNVETVSMDLVESLKSVRQLFEARLTKRNIRFTIEREEKPPTEGYRVLADPSSLATPILSNIISNAINYSADNYQFSAKLRVFEEDFIVLEVRDMGHGMTKARVDDILNPLASKAQEPQEDGTALSLPSISKYLEIIGARLTVDSRPKELYPDTHGTTVRIMFKRGFPE